MTLTLTAPALIGTDKPQVLRTEQLVKIEWVMDGSSSCAIVGYADPQRHALNPEPGALWFRYYSVTREHFVGDITRDTHLDRASDPHYYVQGTLMHIKEFQAACPEESVHAEAYAANGIDFVVVFWDGSYVPFDEGIDLMMSH